MLNVSVHGWFILPRDIIGKIYDPTARMCDYGATVWLMSQAAFVDYKQAYRGKVFEIKRGQVPYSVRHLADSFNWSNDKVMRFLDNLETAGIITTHKSTVLSILTICNYDEIQNNKRIDKKQPSTHSMSQSQTRSSTSIKNQTNKQKKPTQKFSKLKDENLLDWQRKIKGHVTPTQFEHWIQKLHYDGNHVYCEEGHLNFCEHNLQAGFKKALGKNFRGFKVLGS